MALLSSVENQSLMLKSDGSKHPKCAASPSTRNHQSP